MHKYRLALFAFGAILALTACGGGEPAKAVPARVTTTELGVAGAEDDKLDHATTEFKPDTVAVRCLWKSEGFGATTTIRGVWIAEDVGDAAPANTKIAEKSMPAPFMNTGTFSLTKPNKGFPVGKYRLELYLGEELAKTVPFSVVAAE